MQGPEVIVKEEAERLEEPDMAGVSMETVFQTHAACMFGHIARVAIVTACMQPLLTRLDS